MTIKSFFLVFLSAFFFLILLDKLSAQETNQQKNITLQGGSDSKIFSLYDFNGGNKIFRYVNKVQLLKMKIYEQEGKHQKLYEALRKYVSKFGIPNFYYDTQLIWNLAKLTELLGSHEEAMALYRLVLKHHHDEIDLNKVELYYDSLNTQEIEQFVPIDYYYELVQHRKLIDTLRPPHSVLLNMGRRINSVSSDYGPSLSLEDNTLFFTSKRNQNRSAIKVTDNEDIFYSTQSEYGEWSDAQPIASINSADNEGSPSISNDGETLVFSRCGCQDCYGNCDIFIAQLQEDSTWGNIRNMGVNINSISWDSHPSLNHTGDTLYFASDRLGGFGLSDIYFSVKDKNDVWQPAKNMGAIINTRDNDVSPHFHHVHQILYFSSNGQLYNFGEFDIYKAYLQDGKWSEPINLGPLINGKGREFYFSVDSHSKNIFYARSSSKDVNELDIYSFPMPMQAQPTSTTRLKGSLTDSLTGNPFSGIVSIIDLDNGVEVAPKFLKPDGSFEFDLINNNRYLLVLQGDDFFRIEQIFELNGEVEIHKVTHPLASRIKFESIEFEVGKALIKPKMYADLNKVVNFLYDNFDFKLKITGHTDQQGDSMKNMRLSKSRASTIRDYIVTFAGIHESRVIAEGLGDTQPIVNNEKTERDRKINRRVEFEIYRTND